jgi:hypothetical protein
MLYAFFWVTPWRLNFICRRFGTLCMFHLHRRCEKDKTSVLIVYDLSEVQTWHLPHINLYSSYLHHLWRLDTVIYSPTNTQGGSYTFRKFYALLHTPTFFSVLSTSSECKKHTCCINSVATIFSSSTDQRLKQKYLFRWHATCQYKSHWQYFQTPAEMFLAKNISTIQQVLALSIWKPLSAIIPRMLETKPFNSRDTPLTWIQEF